MTRRRDLAAHRSTWDEPVSTVYRGRAVWECPPNGQGVTALLALTCWKAFDLSVLDPFSRRALALPDRGHAGGLCTTPAIRRRPASVVCADGRAQLEGVRRRAPQVDRPAAGRAGFAPRDARGVFGHGVYLCAVDGQATLARLSTATTWVFGTGIVPAGPDGRLRGFTLADRGHNFSLDPATPTRWRRARGRNHTIIPGMITHAAETHCTPRLRDGGLCQPQGHVQVVGGAGGRCARPAIGAGPAAVLHRAGHGCRECGAGGQPAGRAGGRAASARPPAAARL